MSNRVEIIMKSENAQLTPFEVAVYKGCSPDFDNKSQAVVAMEQGFSQQFISKVIRSIFKRFPMLDYSGSKKPNIVSYKPYMSESIVRKF